MCWGVGSTISKHVRPAARFLVVVSFVIVVVVVVVVVVVTHLLVGMS